MTLWGHALFSTCTAADCLHFANQSVAMVTHPSPSPTKTPISIPLPSICLFHHTAIPPPLSLFRPHSFPLFIYDSMHCLVTWPKMFRKGSTGRTHTQTHKLLIGARHPQVQEILVLVSRRKQLVVWRKRDIRFLPICKSNSN